MINYSFIIPHHNTPDLLERCVKSIPQRDDIEIIVVDDNSDEDKKPTISREGVIIILLDATQSKGAGRARNVGMRRAQGKWLLFADADDFYKKGFLNFLDDLVNSKNDAIYFSADSVKSDTLEPDMRTRSLQLAIKEFDGSEQVASLIKYKHHAPWNKMVSADFILKYGIQFEEVEQGNDTMFSYMVGYFAKNIKVIPMDLYTYTYTENSITTRKKNMVHYHCGVLNYFKQAKFLRFVGKPEYALSPIQYLARCYRQYGFEGLMKIVYIMFTSQKEIRLQSTKYIKIVQ